MSGMNAGFAKYLANKKANKTPMKGTTRPNKFSGKKNVVGSKVSGVMPKVGSKMKKLMGFKNAK